MPKPRYIIPLMFVVMALSIIATPVTISADFSTHTFEFTAESGADPDTTYGDSWTVDFSSLNAGVYTSGVGYEDTATTAFGSENSSVVQIQYVFAEPTYITNVVSVYDQTAGSNSPTPNTITLYLDSGQVAASPVQSKRTGSDLEIEFDGFVLADEIRVSHWASNDVFNGSTVVKRVIVNSGDPEYTKPISLNNNSDWDTYEHPDESTVIAVSSAPGDYVYAIGGGTVTEIEPYTNDDQCQELVEQSLIEETFTGYCFFTVPSAVSGSSGDYSYVLDDSITKRENWYRVTVEYEGDSSETHEYFVADSEEFIELGMSIDAGCIMGRTLPFKGWEFQLSPEIFGGTRNSRGVVWVERRVSDEPAELLDYLLINPEAANACNVAPEHSTCLGDSALQYPEDWNTQGGATIDSPGATLPGYSSIYQQYNLNPDRTPEMRVGARAFGGSATMILSLGTTQITHTVTGSEFKEYLIAAAAHTADSGLFFTIQVQNDSPASLEIDYVCIRNTTEDDGSTPIDYPDDEPPVCFFENYSFNSNSDWSTSGGVSYETGAFVLASDGVISQDVTLHEADDSSPQAYTVTAEIGLDYAINYSEDPTASGINFDFEYQVPGASWAVMSPEVTDGEIITADNKVQVSGTFNVSSETTGSFGFRYTPDTALGAALQGIAYRKVCICLGSECDTNSPGLEDFPGYDEDGIPDLPFEPTCDVIERPSGNSIGHWITYLWGNLNSFFQCDLMVLLNQIYTFVRDGYRLMGWNIRYWQSSFVGFMDWLEFDFFPWLAGYLTNAGGNTYVYESGNENCAWYNILCHVVNALDILGEAFGKIAEIIIFALDRVLGPIIDFFVLVATKTVDFIFLLLEALLSIAFLLLLKMIEALTYAKDWLTVLAEAWNNATPETLPGIPDCDLVENQTVGLCLSLWSMENSIFSGDAGMLIIPLFTSVMSMLMIIFFVKKWKVVAQSVVDALE